jgi:hypothetical protein
MWLGRMIAGALSEVEKIINKVKDSSDMFHSDKNMLAFSLGSMISDE